MDWTTRGKTVFITGAARGLGAETARRVAARGANVALVGLEPEELERVAAQCGANAAWFECDVTDADALERAVQGTLDRFGGIDVVMANAGIAPVGMTRSTDPEAFERTIEINLLGVWRTVRACLPHVIERQGYVYVTASMAAAAARLRAWPPTRRARPASRRSATRSAARSSTWAWTSGVGYFGFIDTDMVRGADAHPAIGKLREQMGGPLSKTYPLSKAGQAIADGIEGRKRWIVVPAWARALIFARTLIQPLIEKQCPGARGRGGRRLHAGHRGARRRPRRPGPVGPGRRGREESRAGDPARRRGGSARARARRRLGARAGRAG